MLAASYEAKAYGVRTAMGGRAGTPPVPAGGRRRAADVGLLRGEQGGVRGVRGHDAAGRGAVDRRGVPRRRAGCGGSRARRPRSRCGCGATSSSGSGCPSRSAWRGRSSSPRWRAAWPSPTACWWCRPTASWPFSIRCRSSGSGGSGRSPPASSTTAASGRSARWPSSARRRWSRCSGGRRAGTSTRSPTTAIPGRVQVGRRRGSIGSQRALGRSPRSPEAIDAVVVGAGRPCHAPDAGRRAGRAHGRAPVALRRLLAGDSLAHAAPRDRADPDDPRHGAGAAGDGDADDRAAGPHAGRGSPSATSTTTARSSSRCRSTATAAARSMPRSTRCATGSGPTRSPAPCCSAATRACRCRCCPTESTGRGTAVWLDAVWRDLRR